MGPGFTRQKDRPRTEADLWTTISRRKIRVAGLLPCSRMRGGDDPSQALRAPKTCNPTQARHHSATWVAVGSGFKYIKNFALFTLIDVVVELVLSRTSVCI